MKNRSLSLLVVVLCLFLAVSDAWAAKRLGGARSVGRQRDTTTMQRAPAPPPPAAAPGLAPASPGLAQPRPMPGAMPAPQRSSWLGPLAGFAGGALLGGLLFGHGGFGGGGGFGLGGLIMPLLLIGGFIFLLRRFMSSANALPRMAEPMPAWNGAPAQPAQPAYAAAAGMPQGAGAVNGLGAPARPDMVLPAGFDLPGFLRESKLAFVRLQAANDGADLTDLREFTTPQMYAELAMQIQERGGAAQRVDVLALEADLLDLTVQGEEAVGSVQYVGTLREDGGNPEAFSEIWHVRKRLDQANSPWLLAGIQQLA